MVRHVLRLPKQHDESAFKVEPIIRKTIQTEERNRYFFGGRIEDRAPSDFPEPRTSPVGRAAGVSAYRQSP
jgi:serine protease inhibitor ecotin